MSANLGLTDQQSANLELMLIALQLREGAIKIYQKVVEYARLVTPGKKMNFISLYIAQHMIDFGRFGQEN